MKIVVIGGGGLIGAKLVNTLLQLGHTVVPASPQYGIDTITGEGLYEAVRGSGVVIDVSNSSSYEDKAALSFFQKSTMNLLTCAIYSGVKHYVALSVVGADRLPVSGYLRAKIAQEDLIKESGIAYTIVRSTQFFEFAGKIAALATMDDEVHISPAAFQPIAADEVVLALADIIVASPLNDTVEIAGLVCMPMYEFIRYYLTEIEDSRRLIMDEHARYFGAELSDESLVPADNARLGTIKYEDWFQAQLIENRP